MPKNKVETIVVPLALCRILIAEKTDVKNPQKYDDMQKTAKDLLKVLIAWREK
jgi:hypothetical protein